MQEKKRKQAETERKRAEVRARLEEASKAKKAKKGFMTPDRKKKLRVSPCFLFLSLRISASCQSCIFLSLVGKYDSILRIGFEAANVQWIAFRVTSALQSSVFVANSSSVTETKSCVVDVPPLSRRFFSGKYFSDRVHFYYFLTFSFHLSNVLCFSQPPSCESPRAELPLVLLLLLYRSVLRMLFCFHRPATYPSERLELLLLPRTHLASSFFSFLPIRRSRTLAVSVHKVSPRVYADYLLENLFAFVGLAECYFLVNPTSFLSLRQYLRSAEFQPMLFRSLTGREREREKH